MKSIRGRKWLIAAGILLVLVASGYGVLKYLSDPTRGLPYADAFAQGKAEEWKAFGGTWELRDGSMRNDSDERGAKLLTGSKHWTNYSIEADVMLLGESGNAGLIVRSSDEEEGVDAYTGYYAGLRNLDNSLVLGRAGHGWMEVTKAVRFDGSRVVPERWYHLKLLAYGCQLVAMAEAPMQATRTALSVKDVDCVLSGRAGLRSYAAGGIWRNVSIREATEADAAAMLTSLADQGRSVAEEQMNDSLSFNGFHAPLASPRTKALPSSPNALPISSLKLFPFAQRERATIRGVVTITAPALYVEDSSGGVMVQKTSREPLRVGDEVEATGVVHPGDFNASLEDATVRVLWAGTPIPALSVTASQAATGAFDAEFIEVEGRLRAKTAGADDTLIFDLDSGPQSFRAVMTRGRGDSLYNRLKEGSLLRIQGVSVAESPSTQEITPFTLLVRSTDDFVELAGPPWWSTGHLVAIAIGLLLLALLANFLYHRVDHWRLQAIVEEREHLAFEMHDTLAQGFAGIGFQLEAIRAGVPEELLRMHEQLNLATDLVRHSHAEARRTVDMLRPQHLESEGLLNALAFCARRLVAGGTVGVTAKSTGEIQPIPLRMSDNLYRIGQEALANAVRHAHPSTLSILLEHQKTQVRLTISDDGAGFLIEAGLGGFGLTGMRKRAASIASDMQILSAPGNGTQVIVTVPLPPRVTIVSWPRLLRTVLKEHLHHATAADAPHPHPYRR